MIGVVYEDSVRHELPGDIALALRALGLGYGHIKPMHASYLRTFELCFRGIDGYEITKQGRDALAAWDKGDDYDPRTFGRQHSIAPGVPPGPEPGTTAELLSVALVELGREVHPVPPVRDGEPEAG